ncbi:hypothetical protein OKW45_004852 [Paraburkholderia sp. WSM4175]
METARARSGVLRNAVRAAGSWLTTALPYNLCHLTPPDRGYLYGHPHSHAAPGGKMQDL